MNLDIALREVYSYIGQLEAHRDFYGPRPFVVTLLSHSGTPQDIVAAQRRNIAERKAAQEIERLTPTIVGIALEFAQDIADQIESFDETRWKFFSRLGACERLVGLIIARQKRPLIHASGDPGLDLHPVVADAALDRWRMGHRRDAIQRASTAVEQNLKEKLCRWDKSGATLYQQAFSVGAPEPGSPRLRIPFLNPGSEEWRDAHIGAKCLGEACTAGIRNRITHNLTEPDEATAAEALAALSLLARWIDEAVVERSSEETG